MKDFNEIKKHDFFKKIDWCVVEQKGLKAPLEMFINEQENNYYDIVNL